MLDNIADPTSLFCLLLFRTGIEEDQLLGPDRVGRTNAIFVIGTSGNHGGGRGRIGVAQEPRDGLS